MSGAASVSDTLMEMRSLLLLGSSGSIRDHLSSQYQWNFKHSAWKSPHLQARSLIPASLCTPLSTLFLFFFFFFFSFFKRRIPFAGTVTLTSLAVCLSNAGVFFLPLLPEENVVSAPGHISQRDGNTTQYADQLHRNIITERERETEKERECCWKTAHCFKTQLSFLLHCYLHLGIWDSLINME